MLYIIDQRPVIIYLSIHSVFVDVMFHIHSANHCCTSGLLHHWTAVCLFFYCLWFHQLTFTMLSSINSPSPCWSTLYTSNKCPPGHYPTFIAFFRGDFPSVMLAVVNCNLPVSDLNGSHAQFILGMRTRIFCLAPVSQCVNSPIEAARARSTGNNNAQQFGGGNKI